MPLPTDPKKYPDGPWLYALSVLAVAGEDYEHTFSTNGEVHQFSQKFYMYRKAVEKALNNLEAKKQKALRTSITNVKRGASLSMVYFTDNDAIDLAEWQEQIHILNQIVIKKPSGSNGLTIRLTTRESTLAEDTPANDFISKRTHLLPPKLREVFEPGYVDTSPPRTIQDAELAQRQTKTKEAFERADKLHDGHEENLSKPEANPEVPAWARTIGATLEAEEDERKNSLDTSKIGKRPDPRQDVK